MRALFGVVSLLVVLAIVGLLAAKALRTSARPATIDGVPVGASSAPGPPTAREQSRQMQQQVADDVARALQQGSRRTEDADK